jgi:CDP-diacylglycerol--glycerol-3-phosphate 3-phosphatidyltransferase
MPTIYDLKPRFQALLRPTCRYLARLGVTPNHVTVSALVLSLCFGFWLANAADPKLPLLALVPVLIVRMMLNAIDGMLAREHAMASRAGVFLNELGDVLSDAALYLPFALVPGVHPVLVVVVVVLGIVGEMTGVIAATQGGERRYDGPLGKSDRAFAFGLAALLLGIGIAPGLWLDIYLGVLAALAVSTVLNRTRAGLRASNGSAG